MIKIHIPVYFVTYIYEYVCVSFFSGAQQVKCVITLLADSICEAVSYYIMYYNFTNIIYHILYYVHLD